MLHSTVLLGSLIRMTNQPQDDYIDTILNVRYAETDQMGIVYYANYMVWFEVGRVGWCRQKGFRYKDMEEQDGRFMTVAEATCRYKSPARFEDDIIIRTRVAAANERIIKFGYEVIHKETGTLLATGETTHVVTDSQVRPSRIPDRFRHYFNLPTKR
jgi:acyl-CoA thioester hydrolase